MSSFTPSQLAALDFSSHSSVTANAGSGKTRVLIHRFLNILLESNIHIREIVAVTFTDKAASELRKKISELVEEKMGAEKGATLKRLTAIRDNLASARIETIHSFCSNLLREYPIEADVDAGFTIVESSDESRLLDESMSRVFHRVLGEPTAELHTETEEVVRIIGKKKLEEVLRFLIRKREQVERLLVNRLFRLPENEIVTVWNETIHHELLTHISTVEWQRALEKILLAAKGKTVREIRRLYNELRASPSIELYKAITEEVLTDKHTMRKTFFGKADEAGVEQERLILSAHAQEIETLLEVIFAEGSLQLQKTLARVSKILFKLFVVVMHEYERHKDKFGYLDFEDLLLKTKLLLNNEQIRRRLRERFKYIMVDEYQDTNRIQYEILKPLIEENPTGNLFIVGDPKQSIYGFRKAEVEVFEETKSDLGNAQRLAESFRPLNHLVMFVNKVFSAIMVPPQSDIQYEPLVRGRQNDADGSVELLIAHTGSEEGGSNTSLPEEELIARKITHLIASQKKVFTKEEKEEEIQYKHIAVLLRSRTHLKSLEAVFNRHNIPFVVAGGIGFYQTQELYDFHNYFLFLLNQKNDVALTGVLRSPFFHCSDAELFTISVEQREHESFWEKLDAFSMQKNCSNETKRAVEVLKETISVAQRIPLPFLIQKIINDSGWSGIAARLPNGGQMLANIEKLRRLARTYEGLGYTTLYDFTERLKTLMESVEREGQEMLETGNNAVHIMTIHAAKGLEFPTVILPYCDKQLQNKDTILFDVDTGIGFSWENSADGKNAVIPTMEFLKYKARQKYLSEEMRVFYVACTRARDRLIISSTLDDKKGYKQSYMQWVLRGLAIGSNALHTSTNIVSRERITVLEKKNEAYSTTEKELQLSIPITSTIAKTEASQIDIKAKEPAERQLFLEPIKASKTGNFFSATQIQTYQECPSKYYLRYVLGLPEQNKTKRNYYDDDERDGNPFGGIIGKLTHSTLQEILRPIPRNEIDEIITKHLSTEELLDEDTRKAIFEEVEKNVLNFTESEYGRGVLLSQAQETEKTFNATIGNDYFVGTIDRFYRDNDKNIAIVDYKTTKVSGENIEKRGNSLLWQMKSYVLLAKRYAPEQKSFPVTIFFTHHPAKPQHFRFSSVELEVFEKEVLTIISHINNSIFTRNVNLCERCPYEQNGHCIIAES